MRLIGKLIIIIFVIGILLGASAYIIVYTGENNNSNNGGQDTEPPQINDISGDFTVIADQNVIVTVLFSDNVNVTLATLYYKIAGATSWSSESILSGSANVPIPSSATSNYYYYITVDDAAGNGPVGNPSIDGTIFYTITVLPNGSNPDNETFTHQVFIEESTSVTCHFCPNVGVILENLESSSTYANQFYYVSMVIENTKAADHLTTVYNRYADPTVYVDGGYRVILGGLNPEANYTTAIQAAKNRLVPKIRVTVTAEYKNTSKTLATNVLVVNGEQYAYSGRLRVYLMEIISSQFNDYNGLKYRNAFVDFIINKDISVSANSDIMFSANWSVGNLDYENLKVIAAVFNATDHAAFSDPPTDKYPFTAHYADAVNATYVVKGARNLPPEVGILSPQNGKIYFRGNLFLQFLYKKNLLRNTWIIGKATIDTYAKDDSGIAKVEFYVNNNLVVTMTNPPYNWTLQFKLIKKPLIPKTYTIMVKAYDDTNKTATASIDVKAWWAF
jgi:Bacterial Ig domain